MASIYGPMTDERKEQIWHLWQQGRPMSEIARNIAKPPATVYSFLLYHGGIKPRSRSRRPTFLALEERELISRSLASGDSIRSIARLLGRSPSTISREISRNGGCQKYRAYSAENSFLKKSKRPKPLLLASNIKLKMLVTKLLQANWSPEQIAGWLKDQSPDGKMMCVSHETIYKSLFVQTRGVLREDLKKHLRTKRMFRHSKTHKVGTRGQIVDAISISERPAEIEDRAIPGHWEGDLIIGSGQSAIATLVERKTRFTMLCKIKDKKTATVVSALTKQMKKLPNILLKTLTWDRGNELSGHKKFTIATDMKVYFCDPGRPWQRGTNENTNGLLRQYFPKGTSLNTFSQKQLDSIAKQLNSRPRKTLEFKTPTYMIQQTLQ